MMKIELLKKEEKNMKRSAKVMCIGAILSVLSANAAFAGVWVKGQEPNQDKWWYQNDDGTYAQNGWFWIDGNHDGIAEYYYFDSEGWALTNTVTPDGNQVNENGEWVLNGTVQTQQTDLAQTQDGQAALWMWTENADGKRVFNDAVMKADFDDYIRFLVKYGSNYETTVERIEGWARTSERGAAWKALFDRYAVPVTMDGEQLWAAKAATFTTAPGMSVDDQYAVTAAMQMILWIKTDGMSQAEFNTTISGDGAITVNATLQMFG